MAARSTNGTRASADDAAVTAAQVEAAEAEAAEAQALASAAAARAKAVRLRKQAEESRAQAAKSAAEAEAAAAEAAARAKTEAEQATPDEEPAAVVAEPVTVTEAESAEAESAEDYEAEDAPDAPSRGWRRWVPGWRAASVGAAVTVLVALLAASGYLIWSHHEAMQRQQREGEFRAGARQDVINLMSLNFNNGQADLQRVLDTTSGSFHDDFVKSQKDFLTVMQDSKVVTSTTVSATALESMTDDSAVVLVTATSQVANSASQQPTPRSWRLSVTVHRENDQIKMSKVEFVP
jgi:Mce-associated membrane protein